MKNRWKRAGEWFVLVLLMLVLTGCAKTIPQEKGTPTAAGQKTEQVTPTVTEALQDGNGTEEPAVTEVPITEPTTEPIATQSPTSAPTPTEAPKEEEESTPLSLSSIPEYEGEPFVIVNENTPVFSSNLKAAASSFEEYSALDALGRCGVALSCVGKDIMPTEDREGIGQVKPTGWHTVKYDIVDGKYLYNRCHLIGFQLTGENANEKNLITGTRAMNVDGMLPFENMIADYVKETNNHVLYRVTPIYENDNLIATGVQMEAYSIEDNGDGICFNVFCYNAQPGIELDYKTGDSWLLDEQDEKEQESSAATEREYVLNTNTKKFHYPDCRSVKSMSEKNKKVVTGTRDELIGNGYVPCGNCKP